MYPLRPKVSIVRGKRSFDPVSKALDLIDYKSILKDWERILIKVNFITTKTWDSGATTDPVVVEAIIKRIKDDLSAKVIVVESDATTTNADKAFKITGIRDVCERYDVEFINLRKLKDRVKLPVPNHETLRTITVPRIITESAIISAAKLKTHFSTGVTLGMKNMFGLLPDKFKSKYHFRGIDKVIVDINTVLPPTLTVIDGFVGMEGRGPVNGDPIQMDLIIAGKDPVATDSTACRVMGINPHEIKHITLANKKGLGAIENLDVVGEKLEDVKRTFKRK